jgi:hypothetical protein
MTPRHLRIAGFAAFGFAAISCVYAWAKYDDNAAEVESVNANRWEEIAGESARGPDFAPAMPDEGRNALWLAVGLAACGLALLRISSKPRA